MSENQPEIKAHTALSLDLGSTIGWAICKDAKIEFSGTHTFSAKDAHPGHRFLHFRNWLIAFKGVKEVIYEDVPRFESAGAAKVYCGFLAVVQMFCLEHGIRLTGIKASSVKKDFTGKGNAKKEVMCAHCHAMGWKGGKLGTILDHDEADAIATMVVVMARREVQVTLQNLKDN